ncbi:iron-containing alcohol dehydrogenase [Salidesulfovibrio onnuriiensis]|uniref:iron-containing alcohol dehydrogenase n=1 Tax=Salidesulfovibrio onnuriiensis TaxID=2583823 RepID=UPI0011CA404D|nr:iron-containing alcohol dehydrogenase [Salidesulfovibrio onnuriiensis]
MFNFNFHNPTRIVFGKDQLRELDTLVPADARVLITFGGGSARRTGLLDRVKAELDRSGRTVLEFGGIEPNPQFATLMKAVEIVRAEKVDFLLAVGGGSVMDGTKFISLASANDEFKGREEAVLSYGFAGVPAQAAVPLGTVVTLPATGSEMNMGAVISKGEDKLVVMSPLVFPTFSILDPELTCTLPENQVANGIVDTFVHVVEQYVTFPVEGRLQDRFAEGILQTLIEVGRRTKDDPQDYDARANLVWSATMALNGLIGSGVPQDWAVHMIGHELTALHGVDHGRSLAAVLPGMWRVRRGQKREKLLQYAERVWGIREGSDDERIDAAIARTEDFFHSLGVSTRLSDLGITEEHFDAVIASLEKHGMTALSEHGDLNLEVSLQVLEASR